MRIIRWIFLGSWLSKCYSTCSLKFKISLLGCSSMNPPLIILLNRNIISCSGFLFFRSAKQRILHSHRKMLKWSVSMSTCPNCQCICFEKVLNFLNMLMRKELVKTFHLHIQVWHILELYS